MTTPRHVERERLQFCGVDVQDIVDAYVEKHWGDYIRRTAARYRIDDRNGKETDEMEGEAREMTLDEMLSKLPEDHGARRELDRLRSLVAYVHVHDTLAGKAGLMLEIQARKRAQRVQVASRVLAALIEANEKRDYDEQHTGTRMAEDAAHYAAALLARIDETEPKDETVNQVPQPLPGSGHGCAQPVNPLDTPPTIG